MTGDKPSRAQLQRQVERLTIKRVNVHGDYHQDNCAWIENCKQAHNTRKTKRLCGMVLSEAEKQFWISRYTLKGRMRSGWSEQEAVTVPPVLGRNQFGLPRR